MSSWLSPDVRDALPRGAADRRTLEERRVAAVSETVIDGEGGLVGVAHVEDDVAVLLERGARDGARHGRRHALLAVREAREHVPHGRDARLDGPHVGAGGG